MLRDFLLDVLAMRQGSSIKEPAILLHGLPLAEPCVVSSWRDFLRTVVQPGSYVLGRDASSLVREQLALEERTFARAVLGRVDDPGCEQRLAVIRGALGRLDSGGTDLAERWVNTGLYLGSDRAWGLYIDELGDCLELAWRARECLASAEALGLRIGRVARVDELMGI